MKYYVVKCNVMSSDLNEETYGILAVDGDNSREYHCDISKNINEVSYLVDEMTNYNVEPQQAKEIIEDFIFKKASEMHT